MLRESASDDILDKIFFITERVVVFDGIDDVFEHIVKTSAMLTRAEAATIRIFDMNRGDLRIVKGFGVSSGFLSQPPVKLGEGITGRVVLEGKPFLTNNVTKVSHCVHKELARLEEIKALMSIPLKTRENTIGCITVYRKKEESFTEHDLLLLSIFATQVTEAVEKTQLLEEMKKQAMFDPLTGLYNKAALLKELDSGIKLALRHGYDMSIMFIDIDDFKKFNDTHGHLLGDKLLSDFSKIMKKNCRKTDIVGRFGGEEFVIITPHTTKKGVLALAGKLKKSIRAHKFVGQNKEVCITFSAGVSAFNEDGLDATELLKKADDAMYRSKKAGKNRITLWSGGLIEQDSKG
ncbi:MAG: sensor domain-containing diguanylate cyclase [Nitrospirae bacterium]|nr:sensor domain-containing diguanylate cyclase [Nitrospirota bacterium]